MTQTPELKPCPFCGTNDFVTVDDDDQAPEVAVGCFMQMEGGCGFVSDRISRKHAIEAWNTRVVLHQPADAQGLVRELRDALKASAAKLEWEDFVRLDDLVQKANTYLGEQP